MVHDLPPPFQRIPPRSHSDSACPHVSQRMLHLRVSASMSAAHLAGRTALKNRCIGVIGAG